MDPAAEPILLRSARLSPTSRAHGEAIAVTCVATTRGAASMNRRRIIHDGGVTAAMLTGGRQGLGTESPCESKGAQPSARAAPEPSLPIQKPCDPKHATKAAQHLMPHQSPPRIVGRGNYRAIPVRRTEYSTTRFGLPLWCGVWRSRSCLVPFPPSERKTRLSKVSAQLRQRSRRLLSASERCERAAIGDGGRKGAPDRCSGALRT
jgi:hypothetical protein